MIPSPPRTWKEFDGRWRKATRMEKFLVVSLLLHLAFALCWALPQYWTYRIRQQVMARKAQQEEERKQHVQKEYAAAEEKIKEQNRKDLAETQLREFYEQLAKDLLSDEELEQRWEELLAVLGPELAALDDLLSSDAYDELTIDEHVSMLRERLIERLYEGVARDLQEQWKQRYLKHLEEAIGKLAELFQKELNSRIGGPLDKEARRLIEREVASAKQALSAATGELQAVKREAEKQKSRIEQSGRKVAREAEQIERETKAQTGLQEQLTGAAEGQKQKIENTLADSRRKKETSEKSVVNEASTARDVGKTVDGVKAPLTKAADKVRVLAPEIATKVEAIRDALVPQAVTEVSAEADHLAKVETAQALEKGKAAADAAQKIAGEADAAAKEIASVDVEKAVRERLKALLADLLKAELTASFEDAFNREYKGYAYQELFDLINKQFQEEAIKKGIVPPPLSIEEELTLLLGVKLPEKTDAGATTTAQLKTNHGLADVSTKPVEGALEEGAGKDIRSTAAGLIDREMRNVVTSALGNKGSWLFGSDVELDEQGQWDVALLDRLGNLKNQVGQGRSEFLGRGDAASLLNARQRNLSLARARGRLSRYYDSGFDEEAFLFMMDKMKNRTNAKGEVFALEGEAGDVSKADETDMPKPEQILVGEPPASAEQPEHVEEQKREVQKPEFKYNEFTGVPYLNKPIVIDGDLSDWQEQKVPKLTMTRVVKAPEPKGMQYDSQDFWLAYDARGLYIAVDAKDTTGALENHLPLNLFWENDCIEIFIDSQNTKYSRRGETHTHQFFVFPFGQKDDPEPGGYEALFDSKARWIPTFPKFNKEIMPRAAKTTELGWTIEFIIPKGIIRQGELKPGRIIGFTLSCCTGSDIYYYWSFHPELRTSENPNTWGDIQLLGSDATLSILDKDANPASGVFPGEPLRVQVIDGDMNLDTSAKDKLRVSASGGFGDYEQLVLEETEVSSGIFSGSIATRPNIGAMTAGVLDLYEGEEIKIEYIDQAQAYGERDVRVARIVRASAGGVNFVQK